MMATVMVIVIVMVLMMMVLVIVTVMVLVVVMLWPVYSRPFPQKKSEKGRLRSCTGIVLHKLKNRFRRPNHVFPVFQNDGQCN